MPHSSFAIDGRGSSPESSGPFSIRFRYAYAQPVCTPTRAQLITGKYNIRNYDNFGTLPAGQITFANLLRDAGYKTFIAGKWQLNGDYDTPITFGFDEYFLWQLNRKPNRYYAPGFEVYIPADALNKTRVNYPPGTYGPELVTEKILQFIERNQAGPFLVYYPMLLTHNPFTPTPDHPDYDPASTNELTDPIYFGSMVEYMDELVGRIVDKLDELGLRENTLILFLGDNGTGPRITSIFEGQPVQGGKGETTDTGIHVPFIANWSNTIPAGQVSDALIDSSDVLPSLCEAAGVPPPQGIDGRSFLPQLLGQVGTPREWSYCWYKPPDGTEADVVECAHTARFKLYQSGQFYDLSNDLPEQNPLDTNSLSTEAQSAIALLAGALASFSDERQDRTLAPRPDPAVWNSPPSANGPGSIAMTAASGVDANGPAEYQFKNVTLSSVSAWQFTPYFIDGGLSNETSYAYQARMRDLLGNTTAWSDERSATTPPLPNPPVVVIEQAATDGTAGIKNLGQSFAVTPAHDGWFLDSVTFYAAPNTGGTDSAYLTLYDGFTNRANRGTILSVSANSVVNPRVNGAPMVWNFTNILLKAGVTYYAAVSDAAGDALPADQGIPARSMLTNLYEGGSRINENGLTPDVDLKFSVVARQSPSNYEQWTLGIPEGLPNGFGDAISLGEMLNGWKYFLGLGPLESDPARQPRIVGGSYVFTLDPNVTDIFWRICYAPGLQLPSGSWDTAEPGDPDLLYNAVTGQVQLPLPDWAIGFFRLEIGLR